MRRSPVLLAAFAVVAVTMPAGAQPRPDSLRMTCQQAAGLVFQRGALVLGSGPHVYDRYVRDRGFCQPTELTRPAFAPTLDHPQCFVGYRCFEPTDRPWW
jgi:hypothetical protein